MCDLSARLLECLFFKSLSRGIDFLQIMLKLFLFIIRCFSITYAKFPNYWSIDWKLSLKKKLKKRLNTEFPMLRENWTTFSIIVNEYFLPLLSNFLLRFKAVSHFISQNLEAIDPPVPEIKNYNDRHMAFSHKYTWTLWQNYTLWHRKRWRIWICVFTIFMHEVFSRIITQMGF